MCVLVCVCMSVPHMCAMPLEFSKECWTPGLELQAVVCCCVGARKPDFLPEQ